MVVVEERGVGRQAVVEQGLVGGVAFAADAPGEAVDYPAGVCVDDEGGLAGRVEDDVVGRLFADAPDPEQAAAELILRQVQARVEVAAEVIRHERGELLELSRLGVEVAGGPDDAGEPFVRRALHGVDAPDSGGAHVIERFADVCPGGVLGEDGAYRDLERAFAGPPVEWAVGGVEAVKDGFQVVG